MEPLIKATPDMRTPLYIVEPLIKATPDVRTPVYTVEPLIKTTPDVRTLSRQLRVYTSIIMYLKICALQLLSGI